MGEFVDKLSQEAPRRIIVFDMPPILKLPMTCWPSGLRADSHPLVVPQGTRHVFLGEREGDLAEM